MAVSQVGLYYRRTILGRAQVLLDCTASNLEEGRPNARMSRGARILLSFQGMSPPVVDRAAPRDFEEMYQSTPPWDIGRPQPEFVRLAKEGEVRGRVLDVGCGTGENALFLASEGREVWGVDASPTAISKAAAKAAARRSAVTFQVADALRLGELRRTFDTVIDSGLFHVFDDEARPHYVDSLASVLHEGGRYFMICFSEKEPNWGGPRRGTKAEVRSAFKSGWRVDAIRKASFDTKRESGSAAAWLCAITRLSPPARPP